MPSVDRHRQLLQLVAAVLCISSAIKSPLPLAATPAEIRSNARVVIVRHPKATITFAPQRDKIRGMVERGLSALWKTSNVADGWRSCILPDDVVGIRVHSAPGKTGGSRPAVAAALLQSLLDSGHPSSRIILWDRQLSSLRPAGYLSFQDEFGIQVEGARQAGYDESAFYESSLIGSLVWGDHEFGKISEGIGRRSFVTKLLTQKITKIINLAPLLNHNRAGVCGNLVGLALAGVDNTLRFQSDPGRLAIAVPEIIALPEIGDRVVLNVVDALIAQYQGENQARLQDSAVLNELRFSADPVALDVLSINELEKQRAQKGISPPRQNLALYENAALLQLGVSNPNSISVQWILMPSHSKKQLTQPIKAITKPLPNAPKTKKQTANNNENRRKSVQATSEKSRKEKKVEKKACDQG